MGFSQSKQQDFFNDSDTSLSSSASDLCIEEPPRKRARLEEPENVGKEIQKPVFHVGCLFQDVNNCSAAVLEKCNVKKQNLNSRFWIKRPHLQTRAKPYWDHLPYVALVEVYRNLPNNDRFSLSRTCKAWQMPFSRPSLWRRGNFRFNGKDDWRGVCFASMMGGALRHIVVDCSAENSRTNQISSTIESLSLFLTSLLNWNNSNLVTFKLSHLERLVKHFQASQDIVQLLASLLEQQTALRTLDLSHACLSIDEGFQVLFAAGVSVAETVQSLAIEDVISPGRSQDLGSDNRFLLLLSRFIHLTELSLSHKYLSDNVLFLLASALSGKLLVLNIWARYVGRADARTTPESWAHIAQRCPRLKANFSLKGVSHEQSFRDILTPYIPLKSLSWVSGNYNSFFNARNCFDHVSSHFMGTLEHLVIDLHHAFLEDAEEIGVIVERCHQLKSLSVTSQLMSVPSELRLIRAIRKAVGRHHKSQLQQVHVNNAAVNLEETWATSVIGWLIEHVQ